MEYLNEEKGAFSTTRFNDNEEEVDGEAICDDTAIVCMSLEKLSAPFQPPIGSHYCYACPLTM